ncbi:MAG: DUF5320 domain-containing protein [Candidatus ainarchaeum sp.]|nr:DUF5320 domain-containing protein [Candidatus ainarchaeum sp.]
MPNGDGTGPVWAKGAGWGCGRRFGYGAGAPRACIRTVPLEERRKLLGQRKAEIEAELKAIEGKTE